MAIEHEQRADRWSDEPDEYGKPAQKTLTGEEAQALRNRQPALSPWRVVLAQAGVGAVVALLAVLFTGQWSVLQSVLYGAACVVVPGLLLARGLTSPLATLSPVAGAASFMGWAFVKILVSVVMLALAPLIVQPLSWPALLVGLVVVMKVYWVALLWRPRRKS